MQYCLVVISGPDTGASFTLSRRAARIGQGPYVEIPLQHSALPSHAATIETDGMSWKVFNKSPAPIWLAGNPIAPDTSGKWPENGDLDLNGAVLRLESIAGIAPSPTSAALLDPHPSQMPLNHPYVPSISDDAEPDFAEELESEAQEERSPTPSSSPNTVTQLAVTVACLLALPLIFLLRPEESVPAELPITAQQLLDQLEREGDLTSVPILHEFRAGWIADQRHQAAEAQLHYRRVVTLLLAKRKSAPQHRLSETLEQLSKYLTTVIEPPSE